MRTLLSLSVAVLAGLLMTRVAKPLKLPSVTAYLVAGVLIGPYCLGLLGIEGLGFPTQEDVDSLSLISEVALGFIAFSIGSEFRVSELKHTGKQAFVIGVLQALAATFLIDIALVAIALVTNGKLTIAQAITLGAIGTATAPAATLMVVRQYKAKGPLVDLLLPIVALDDAVGLVVFAVSFGIAKALNTGSFDVISIVVDPLIEIVCSLALGALGGWVLTQLEKAVQLQHEPSEHDHRVCLPDLGAGHGGIQDRPGHDRLLVASDMHDARHAVLQPLPAVWRDHGKRPTGGRVRCSRRSSSSPAQGWIWACSKTV